jgi:hypothetical protein
MSDPLRERLGEKRAAKRREAPSEELLPAPKPGLVSQGSRSQPPPRREPIADDFIREARDIARGKPHGWIRI